MEPPFRERDVRDIRDVVEWLYNKDTFEADVEYPDGTKPALLIEKWLPWWINCTRLLDGDGAYAHYMYGTALANEPAIDMHIYDIIRMRWIDLRNEEIKSSGKQSKR